MVAALWVVARVLLGVVAAFLVFMVVTGVLVLRDRRRRRGGKG